MTDDVLETVSIRILCMDEAMEWLSRLDRRDQRLVWAWANREPMWKNAQRFGRSDETIRLWIGSSIMSIAAMLNDKEDSETD